jgi:FKBP-type peptidyl-prolyl cis-trans isomerase
MKPLFLLVAFLAAPWCAASLSAQAVAPKTPKEKLSYAMGMDVGQALKSQSIDVDPQFFGAAVKDSITGAPTQITDKEMLELLTAFKSEMMVKRQAAVAAKAQQSDAFLAANKTKPGVKALPDGLQYKVIKDGTGTTPKATDTVSVHYRGTLVDGKEFDSSYKRGEPATFPVNGVIKGWTEALQLMKVGSKWQLFIPSALAYGDTGAPPDIMPGATLVFEVELLGIK